MLKVLFASRHLFSNWLFAGVKYFLVRHGILRGRIGIRCDNALYSLQPEVYSFIVKAYYDHELRDFYFSYNRDMLKSRLWGAIDFVLLRNGEGNWVMPDGVKIYFDFFDPTVIAETWLYEIHFLGNELSDWFVLDVGAYIGDAALYYAKRGAFVVAIEPLPSNYEAMLKNIELNPDLKPRIIPINVAVGAKDGTVDFTFNTAIDGVASMFGDGRYRVRVRSVKPSTLIKEIAEMGIDLNRFRVRVLKMDCKGCEYDAINETEALKLFDIVKIEYSGYLRNKTYHELKKALEDLGFKCRVWAHNEYALKIGLDKHGVLTCIKSCREVIR
jgi:FkbM family methyltransferase